MGKKLIIKGVDFSENAIEGGLPSRYDYEIVSMVDNPGMIPSKANGYYAVGSDGTLRLYTNGTQTGIPLSEGTILKISDNLYAIYKQSNFNIVTDNKIDVTPEFVSNRVFNYTAPNTIQQGTINGWKSATLDVEKGDIIIYRGKGGGNARLMIVNTDNEIKRVSSAGAQVPYTIAYEVQEDGTMYMNTDSNYTNSELRILR